jgi:cardiolipin synthase (CMP-forming)
MSYHGAMQANSDAPMLTLATKVTIARILGIPVFILLLLYYRMALDGGESADGYRWSALAVFAAVAATDAFDGWLARSRGEVTRLGQILDPIADKALLLSSVILLTSPRLTVLAPQFPIWFALIVISRDAVLIAGAFLIHTLHGSVRIRPHLTGKCATALLMASICGALLRVSAPWFRGLVWTTGAFIAISGLLYLVDGVRQLEHGTPEDRDGSGGHD